MRQGEKEVFSKSRQVGIAGFKIYDSVAEAVADIGDAKVLKMINSKEKTNSMREVREAAKQNF